VNLRLLGQRVLVRPDKRQIEMPGELVAPDTAVASEAEVSGLIEQVGPGVSTVGVGERVLFSPASGFEVHVSKERWLIIPEEQLMAVAEV
jgi:co-chaperonin GroES (HSP10)